MTEEHLIQKVHEITGVPLEVVHLVVLESFRAIESAIVQADKLRLRSFGTFGRVGEVALFIPGPRLTGAIRERRTP